MTSSTLARALGALLLVVPATPLAAQHLTLAVGPTVGVIDWPGERRQGAHMRVGVALRNAASRWNVELEGYHAQWRRETYWFAGDMEGHAVRPRDMGLGVSGTVALFRNRWATPFLRAGAAHHWSNANVHALERGPDGVTRRSVPVDQTRYVGLVLGAGVSRQVGSSAMRVEARLQGGYDFNMPITVGVAF